ncbi:MAG: hypothetical protein N2C14_14545, partial [Planctomycetales bacterium]
YDEIGPIISNDEKTLYLYSDREGGHGGFDIYVSHRVKKGWTTPENLGQTVNTPAHEYDPAITPDGETIFFSSDRTPEMQARVEKMAVGEQSTEEFELWSKSIRGSRGQDFDLYAISKTGDGKWSVPRPLDEINDPRENDGSPYVSPRGGFLYFASKRAYRPGEHLNLDLYRALILDDQVGAVENLGPEINTEHDETEPSLSAEGFLMVFSSNRKAEREDVYRLYTSMSDEIITTDRLDADHLGLFGKLWWPLLLFTGLLAALLGLIALLYLMRGWFFRSAEAAADGMVFARFFLASAMIHMFLLLLMWLWTVTTDIYQVVEETMIVKSNNMHESQDPGESPFEKQADLQSVAETVTTDVQRQIVQNTSVPVPTERMTPTIPVEFARTLPQERVLFAPTQQQPDSQPVQTELQRLTRDMVKPPVPVEPVPLEQITAVASPQAKPIQTEVAIKRSAQTAPSRTTLQIPRKTPRANLIQPAEVDAAAVAETERPPTPRPEVTPPRVARRQPQKTEVAESPSEAVNVEVASAPAAAETPLETVGPSVPRQEVSTQPSPRKIAASAPTTPNIESVQARNVQPAAEQADPSSQATPSQVTETVQRRASRTPTSPAESADEPSDELAAIDAAAQPTESKVAQPKLTVERSQASGAPQPLSDPTASPTTPLELGLTRANRLSQRLQVDTTSQPSVARPSEIGAQLTRATEKIKLSADAAAGEAAADSLEATASPSEIAPVQGVAVGVQRAAPESIRLAVRTPLEIGGPRRFAKNQVVVGELAKQVNNALPTFGPRATSIPRRLAKGSPVAYAEDKVGMQVMFTLRSGDVRQKYIELFGGTDESEKAVRLGLEWLKNHQQEDGRWGLHKSKEQPKFDGYGN